MREDDKTSPSNGSAMYFDALLNTNGSALHAPGERAAASLSALPYRGQEATDALLFGGEWWHSSSRSLFTLRPQRAHSRA